MRLTADEINRLDRILHRETDIVSMVDDGAALRRVIAITKSAAIWLAAIVGGVIAWRQFFGNLSK